MKNIVRNKSFEFELTLKYEDTAVAINLSTLTDITVVIREKKTRTVLMTKLYSTGGVTIVTAASGICSVYVNDTDTASAALGAYEYLATIDIANANFDGSSADFANGNYEPAFNLVA